MVYLTPAQRDHLLSAYGDHGIGMREVVLLLTVADHYAHRRSHPTIRTLAEETGLSEHLVRQCLYRLRDAGMLTITSPPRGIYQRHCNAYHIPDGVLLDGTPTFQEEEYRDADGVLWGCQHCGGALTTNFHTETIITTIRSSTEVSGRTEERRLENHQHRHCWNCEVT